MKTQKLLKISALTSAMLSSSMAFADQVIVDDLIIQGSACMGVDCVNGESFGFDTIRLKENNLRIKAQDTSASASFPSRDWQITFNDSTNGGMNKFSIDDIDGGRTPFTIEASAPSHSLYVDDAGRIGFGTAAPAVNLHLVEGNTPTLRLEQDGSSGFTAQTWDVAGNETNFFIRDVTNGSKLPFRIKPSAPKNSLFIAADGDVGFETETPDGLIDVAHPSNANDHAFLIDPSANVGVNIPNGGTVNGLLDVQTTGGVSQFTVTTGGKVGIGNSTPDADLDVVGTDRLVLSAKNPTGAAWIAIENGSLNVRQLIQSNGAGGFSITREDLSNGGGNYTALLQSDASGNLTIPGTLSQGSNFHSKENIKSVNVDVLLEKLLKLPISSWNYKTDDDSVVHIGPMAQEFFAQFGLGQDDKTISSLDTAGVAIASIQALNKKLEQKGKEISELKELIDTLQRNK
ncbi:tail fiber domain-containing protein [Pseudoalteromonas sp. SSM20]|uniref:tail fiber domain-containing protein n=1 Tax=Pseudoalteromonas sp. SSM20 TaxID=3139394 RepID=UPI003BA9C186